MFFSVWENAVQNKEIFSCWSPTSVWSCLALGQTLIILTGCFMPLIFHEIWFKRLLVCRLLLGFSERGCTWPRCSLPNIWCVLEARLVFLLFAKFNLSSLGGGEGHCRAVNNLDPENHIFCREKKTPRLTDFKKGKNLVVCDGSSSCQGFSFFLKLHPQTLWRIPRVSLPLDLSCFCYWRSSYWYTWLFCFFSGLHHWNTSDAINYKPQHARVLWLSVPPSSVT